jgi:ferredoxin
VREPKFADAVVGAAGPVPAKAAQGAMKQLLARLEGMKPKERLAFWRNEFDRCLRCYACRQACPLCYCKECIVEKNQPQWIPSSPGPKGNFSWNAIRAMHLAGRCVLCGACGRACPVGIPLGALSRLTDKVTQKEFGYRAGYDTQTAPPMRTFKPEDNDSLFK